MRIKSYFPVLLGLALGVGLGKAAVAEGVSGKEGDIIGRWHFVGTAAINADPNAAKWNEIWALPESAALKEATIQKLATTPFRLMNKNSPPRTDDQAALMRPLVEDVLSAETYAELRGASNAWPELMLAVRLDNKRAEIWRKNLATALTAWTGIPVKEIKAEGFTGWELKKHHNPNLFRCIRAGDWVVFGLGQDELLLQPSILQKIEDKKRPVEAAKGYWLDAWADWPSFTAYHPLPMPVKLPKMRLTLEGRKDFVRPQLVLQYAQPLNLKLEPWRIPTNQIHNPLDSFMAVRGIVPWFNQFPPFKEMSAAGPLPGQWFVWAMSQNPFATSVAAPVQNGTKYLERLQASGFAPALNAELAAHSMVAEVRWTTNHEFNVARIPYISPFLQSVKEPNGDFLLGGVVPSAAGLDPMPPDLTKEILARANLVYYDWEITQERLVQWRPLSQFYFITQARMFPSADAPARKWLNAIKPKLGNCGTVVTLTSANELTLVRNSPIGLTGVELTLLGYWLDSSGFPLDAHVDAPSN